MLKCPAFRETERKRRMFAANCSAVLFVIIASLGQHLTEAEVTEQRLQLTLYSFALPHKNGLVDLLGQVTDVSIGQRCRESLVEFADGLRANERNALVMLDSFAKMKPGLFSHQFTDFGNYQQCLTKTDPPARYVVLEILVNSNDTKYFLDPIARRHIWIQNPLVAVCVPGTCSESDVSTVITSQLVASLTNPYSLRVLTSELLGEDQFTDHVYLRYFSRFVLVSILLMSVVSTLLVHLLPKKFAKHKVLSSFDLVTNAAILFLDPDQNYVRTQFFNGFRFFFNLISITVHIIIGVSPALLPYYFSIFGLFSSHKKAMKATQIFGSLTLLNAILASLLNVISSKGEFRRQSSFISYVHNRLWRIWPASIATLLLLGSFPWISSGGGPVMNHMQKVALDMLAKDGWRQLAFISCFQPLRELVMTIGWFISVDMQMYIISFPILYFMSKRPKVGLYLAYLMILGGIICNFVHLIINLDEGPSLFVWTTKFDQMTRTVHTIYFHPSNYISTYGVGFIFGYLIAYRVEVTRQVQQKICLASFLASALLYPLPAVVYYASGESILSRTLDALFASIFRPMLTAAICAQIYYLWHNPSDLLAQFLSSKIFVIASRMSFSVYLVHPIQIMFLLTSDVEAKHYDLSEIVIRGIYITFTSIFFGFLMFVLVECPFSRLRTTLFRSELSSKAQEQKDK